MQNALASYQAQTEGTNVQYGLNAAGTREAKNSPFGLLQLQHSANAQDNENTMQNLGSRGLINSDLSGLGRQQLRKTRFSGQLAYTNLANQFQNSKQSLVDSYLQNQYGQAGSMTSAEQQAAEYAAANNIFTPVGVAQIKLAMKKLQKKVK